VKIVETEYIKLQLNRLFFNKINEKISKKDSMTNSYVEEMHLSVLTMPAVYYYDYIEVKDGNACVVGV
jgi:hypothetical protein